MYELFLNILPVNIRINQTNHSNTQSHTHTTWPLFYFFFLFLTYLEWDDNSYDRILCSIAEWNETYDWTPMRWYRCKCVLTFKRVLFLKRFKVSIVKFSNRNEIHREIREFSNNLMFLSKDGVKNLMNYFTWK